MEIEYTYEEVLKYGSVFSAELLHFIEDPDKAKEIHDTFYLQDKHDAEIKFKEYLWEHTKDDIKEIITTPESKEEYMDK